MKMLGACPARQNMPPPSERQREQDVERIRQALAGDGRAVDEIASRLTCIPRMLGRRNADFGGPLDADELRDLAQETIIAIWRKLEQYDGRASLETWAYRFCMYELLHRLRAKRNRPMPWTDVSPDAQPEEDTVDATPEDHHLLYKSLDRLPDQEATIVRLKHFDDLTFQDIGERLGESPNTIKTRYYRGLLRLRQMLASTTLAEEVS